MTNKPTFVKECSLHPGEPIIRASMDLKSSKLIYCHECLGGVSQDKKSNSLIKIIYIADKIHEQIAEKYEHFQKNRPDIDFSKYNINNEEYIIKIEDIISQQRYMVDKEFDKIEMKILEILQNSRKEVYDSLDKIKENLVEAYGIYTERVNSLLELSSWREKSITLEEIQKELLNKENDAATIEKRIRTRLGTLKIFDDLKEGTLIASLDEQKSKVEMGINLLRLTPSKNMDYYKNELEDLKEYLQAIVFENIDRKEPGNVSNFLPGQSQVRIIL